MKEEIVSIEDIKQECKEASEKINSLLRALNSKYKGAIGFNLETISVAIDNTKPPVPHAIVEPVIIFNDIERPIQLKYMPISNA